MNRNELISKINGGKQANKQNRWVEGRISRRHQKRTDPSVNSSCSNVAAASFSSAPPFERRILKAAGARLSCAAIASRSRATVDERPMRSWQSREQRERESRERESERESEREQRGRERETSVCERERECVRDAKSNDHTG